MPRQPHDPVDVAALSSRRRSDSPVPQEHTFELTGDFAPRDWSRLGRRVLVEAWRRTTEELAHRRPVSPPVVPAPRPETDE